LRLFSGPRQQVSLSTPGVHTGDNAKARALARRRNAFSADLFRSQPGRFRGFACLPFCPPGFTTATVQVPAPFKLLNAGSVSWPELTKLLPVMVIGCALLDPGTGLGDTPLTVGAPPATVKYRMFEYALTPELLLACMFQAYCPPAANTPAGTVNEVTPPLIERFW
jgi:hypothetical protein